MLILGSVITVSILSLFSVDYADRLVAKRDANGAALALTRPSRFLNHGTQQFREAYELSRQGLQFGVSKQALPHAVSQMHAMERSAKLRGDSLDSSSADALSRSATASGTWFRWDPTDVAGRQLYRRADRQQR